MDQNERDRQAVAAVVNEYYLGWLNMDAPRLESIWKKDEGDLVYTALEMARPLRDLGTIKRYIDRAMKECEPPKEKSVDILSTEIIGDVAITYFSWHYEFSFKKPRPAWAPPVELIVADGRATLVLRRTADGWKVMHYHESKNGQRDELP